MDNDPLPESQIKGAEKGNSQANQAKLERMLRLFDTVAMPQVEQRANSLLARRFVTIPGEMWAGQWGEQYENSPRPEIDQISKALEKIEEDFRQNRLTVDYIPGNAADPDTADMLDGVHRADDYEYGAQEARDNGFQEAIRGGMGAYRLSTELAHPDDPDDTQQRVIPGIPIVDADQSVFFDGAAKRYDKADAQWCFVVSAWPRIDATEKWGEGIADWPVMNWTWQYDWFTPDVVKIAEFYEIEMVPDKRLTFTQAQSGATQKYFESEIEAKDIADLKAQGWEVEEKPAKRKRVCKYIMSGSAILKDCGYIAGPNIPIVPIYYRRDWVDSMERWRGYVGKKMDAQRIFNAANAKLTEIDSLSPNEKPVFAPGQIDDKQAGQWARSNIDRLPYLTAHPLLNPDGSVAQTGPTFMVKPAEVPQVTVTRLQFALQVLAQDDDPSEQVKANVSADAMDIAAARVDAKSGIALDNMRKSVAREGQIYLGMAREVYYEPGRKVETLTIDGQDGEAELAQPHIDDNGVYKIRNDLSQGQFKVIASVEEATTTAQDKTVRKCLAAAEIATQAGDQELAQAYILTAAQNMTGEGMQDMVAFARNKAIGIGLTKPTKEEQQQIEQAQQAQGQGQPAPAEQALMAQAGKLQSEAALNAAKVQQVSADAMLKTAQAQAVGGPEKAPEVPSGLEAATNVVDMKAKLAGAELKTAQAEHLRHGMSLSEINTAHDISHARRVQAHAEHMAGQE